MDNPEFSPGERVRERSRPKEILTVECMDLRDDDPYEPKLIVAFTDGTWAYPDEVYRL